MITIVVLASGRGSNFTAVQSAISEGRIQGAKISGVIVDRLYTRAQEYALENSLPVKVLEYKSFEKRTDYDKHLSEAIDGFAPDLLLTLGYLRILDTALV